MPRANSYPIIPAPRKSPLDIVNSVTAKHRRARKALADASREMIEKPCKRASIQIVELFGMPDLIAYDIQTHQEIDDRCRKYIGKCRASGRWDSYHIVNRLVLNGAVCVDPVLPAPRFSKRTLAAYRDRIKDHHQRLNDKILQAEAENVASGARAASDRVWNAVGAEEDAFTALLDVLRRGGDTGRRLCGYVAVAEENEKYRIRHLPSELRRPFDQELDWGQRALVVVASTRLNRVRHMGR